MLYLLVFQSENQSIAYTVCTNFGGGLEGYIFVQSVQKHTSKLRMHAHGLEVLPLKLKTKINAVEPIMFVFL